MGMRCLYGIIYILIDIMVYIGVNLVGEQNIPVKLMIKVKNA